MAHIKLDLDALDPDIVGDGEGSGTGSLVGNGEAGGRICRGRDLVGRGAGLGPGLRQPDSRPCVDEAVAIVAAEMQPATVPVAGAVCTPP